MNANDKQAELLRVATCTRGRRKGSTQERFEMFFLDNPDEELTYQDICTKFDCSPMRAREMVKIAKARLELESVHVVRTRGSGGAA